MQITNQEQKKPISPQDISRIDTKHEEPRSQICNTSTNPDQKLNKFKPKTQTDQRYSHV